jgi:hypothetical protein
LVGSGSEEAVDSEGEAAMEEEVEDVMQEAAVEETALTEFNDSV